jgi:hypothetical protein
MAVKTLTVKAWDRTCSHCGAQYDLEEKDARMAPGEPLVVAETEHPYAVATIDQWGKIESSTCPACGQIDVVNRFPKQMAKPSKKKIELSLLVHPDWLKGEPGSDSEGRPYGGSADDDVEATIRWDKARARTCKLIEVRGSLPDEITCPETGMAIKTGKDGGTVPGKSKFTCQAETCGQTHGIREAIAATGKNGPLAMYAIQGYCPDCDREGQAYGGRFFIPATMTSSYDAALEEWAERKDTDLSGYWPTSEVPFGFMTAMNNGDIRVGHGFTHWWKMFNPRQLLIHSQLLKALHTAKARDAAREYVLGGFQQLFRYLCMGSIWQAQYDKMIPHFSSNNYHPKARSVEGNLFGSMGAGNFSTLANWLFTALDWSSDPWELVSTVRLAEENPVLSGNMSGKSEKTRCGDPLCGGESLACQSSSEQLTCGSSTDLKTIAAGSYDAVITDPPFGGLLHYSELADFFHVWMRLVLLNRYPEYFSAEYSPKTLEAVANKARQDDPDAFYQRLLTECWREAHRILKPGGLLAFTFHHSEDAPWVSVLESLFDAGFTLSVTYPLRGDETKGEGSKPGTFGSQKIEYDIIHVCRKRQAEPTAISWAKLRRQVLKDVRELTALLEHHSREGLPEADLQVIRRGKALEYYSRHYGKVYKDQDMPMTVLEALLGINQLLDEEAGGVTEAPPHNAEPFTRMLLRLFDGQAELARDQLQKFLRGTGTGPSDYLDRGWVIEKKKVFHIVSPLELARSWIGKYRKGMTSDYDQAMFFTGACFEGSGINASETLNNPNFLPHPALGALLTWFKTHGADSQTRNAAVMAVQLYRNWEAKNQSKVQQLDLFDAMGEEV